MAPRFKQLLFQTYTEGQGGIAFIGFPIDLFEQMVPYRNALRDEIEKNTGLFYKEPIVGHWDIDVRIRFFDGKDADIINAFYSKPWPGCLSWLFHTRRYREYEMEKAKVEPLIKIEIDTSHDFPCIVVHKSVFTEDEIAQLIEKVARDLNLNISRSKFLYPMIRILTSNRTFDAGEQSA